MQRTSEATRKTSELETFSGLGYIDQKGAWLLPFSSDGIRFCKVIDQDRQDLMDFVTGKPIGAQSLIRRYSGALLNHASYMLSGDRALAEDLVQNSFLKLWQNAQSLLRSDQELQLKAWLFRVLRNQCLDELRRLRPEVLDEDAQMSSDARTAIEKLQFEDRAKFVMILVDRLPERQRAALLMAHFEGMGNGEIAQIMDCSVEAVENLLARARRALKGWVSEMESVI